MRAANYDAIAAGYDRRYALHEYAGVRDALLRFVAEPAPAGAVVEVGCGTGYWLSLLEALLTPSPDDGSSQAASSRLATRSVESSPASSRRPR